MLSRSFASTARRLQLVLRMRATVASACTRPRDHLHLRSPVHPRRPASEPTSGHTEDSRSRWKGCEPTQPRSPKCDINETIDHLVSVVRSVEEPPIIMGHSFGGALTQLLLARAASGQLAWRSTPLPPRKYA